MKTNINTLIKIVIVNHTPEELALGWLRYETVRRMSARTFSDICKRNFSGEAFDDIVTGSIPEIAVNIESK